jgi:phosphatidylserine synthase
MLAQNKRLLGIVITVTILLLIPFTAMQFSNEVNWSLVDFVVAGTLLLGTGMLCELVMRKVKNTRYRLVIVAVIILALLLIWIELAVGLFGTPFAGS